MKNREKTFDNNFILKGYVRLIITPIIQSRVSKYFVNISRLDFYKKTSLGKYDLIIIGNTCKGDFCKNVKQET